MCPPTKTILRDVQYRAKTQHTVLFINLITFIWYYMKNMFYVLNISNITFVRLCIYDPAS